MNMSSAAGSLLVSSLLLSSSLLAQSSSGVVSPAYFANAAGPDALTPLSGVGLIAGSRRLQIHEGVPAGTISEIAFRPSGRPDGSGQPARALNVTVTISHAATTSASPNANYFQNHGPDRTVVLQQALVNFAAHPDGLVPPLPFLDALTFTTPFAYDGVRPLCWEIEVFETVAAAPLALYDAFVSPDANPASRLVNLGGGCSASGSTRGPFALQARGSVNWLLGTGTLRLTATEGPTLSNAAFLFGADLIDVPLPGTQSGASGVCSLRTTPFTSATQFLTGLGVASIGVPVGLSPNLHGVSITSQVAAVDASANTLGVVTSNPAVMHFVAPVTMTLPVSSVSGFTGSVTGGALVGAGVVIEFR